MTQITGGTVRFERTIQVAQYEPKKASAELSFIVGEGQDHTKIAEQASLEAVVHVERMLVAKIHVQADVAQTLHPVEHKPAGKKSKPAEVAKEAVADPTTFDDLGDPVVKDPSAEAAKDPAAVEEETVAQEIPDKTLVDACSAASKLTQNSEGIRALISEYVAPPGRVANIPQISRGEFLGKLKGIPKLNG